MGVSQAPVPKVIGEVLTAKGQALISVYLFSRYLEEPGPLVVCHDIRRGVISFGAYTEWGRWEETVAVLTIDGTGEQFDY
jgi:hypothetical protein